jgi:DNA-directed RNA polymerase specialized sigma subunit
VALARRGKEAEEKVLVAHFPLVRAMAWKLYTRNTGFVDVDDLIGAGNEGLV